jgi:WD40 repeat protein
VAFSPDGHRIVSGSFDDTLRLWNVETGEQEKKFTGHDVAIWDVAYSPDGKYVLSGADDETIRMWDVASEEEVRIFTAQGTWVTSVTFSPDGRHVLSGSGGKGAKGVLQLWDVRPIEEITEEVCGKRHILPQAEEQVREQHSIPEDVVLCPKA